MDVFMNLTNRGLKFICVLISLSIACGCIGCSDAVPEDDAKETGQAYSLSDAAPVLNFRNSDRSDKGEAYACGPYEKKVAPYKVKPDLSNIENLSLFGSFSETQKKLLAERAFFVSPSDSPGLFGIYRKNSDEGLPSLITSDLVLEIYNSFSDYILRKVENDSLSYMVEKLSGNMLKKSVYLGNKIKNGAVKDAAIKNAAYFAVSLLIFGDELPDELPPEARELAQKEYALVKSMNGYERSFLFPYMINYQKLKPAAHYADTTACSRYYAAMGWYSQSSFPLFNGNGEKLRNTSQTLQALLITYCLFLDSDGSRDFDLWRCIYDAAALKGGGSDDLDVFDYKSLLVKVYGQNPNLEELDSDKNLDRLYREAQELPSPEGEAEYSALDVPSGKQFRLFAQDCMIDARILQGMMDVTKSPYPEGLGVLAAFGSESARACLETFGEHGAETPRLSDGLRTEAERMDGSSIDYEYLRTLASASSKYGAGYPSFMTNQAWDMKSLCTSLSGWAYMRYDGAEYKRMPADGKPVLSRGDVSGYVEPAVALYDGLLYQVKKCKKSLEVSGMASTELNSGIEKMEDVLGFLISCSKKEITNVRLSDDEYDRIYGFGTEAGKIISCFSSYGGKWADVAPDFSTGIAFITDFYNAYPTGDFAGGYKQSGIGAPCEIYAVVPISGKLYLARGAVFSYYEFINTTGTLITDEIWKNMLDENTTPSQPAWTSCYTAR